MFEKRQNPQFNNQIRPIEPRHYTNDRGEPRPEETKDIFAETDRDEGNTKQSDKGFLQENKRSVKRSNSGVLPRKKNWVILAVVILAVIVLLIGLGAAGWFYWNLKSGIRNQESGIEEKEIKTPTPTELPVVEPPIVKIDTDGDGLSDEEEESLGTDPTKPDTDEDGLFDREEVKVWQTDPLNPDTDNDGYKDGEEVREGYNPKGPERWKKIPN